MGDEEYPLSIDMDLYAKAEEKAIRLGKITRLMKETSVDCILNKDVDDTESNDKDNWSKADTQFHNIIIRAADNQTVSGLAVVTRRKIQRFWTRSAVYENRLGSCSKEHEVLAQAIVNKDLSAIEPAVRAHISHMRSSILRILETAAGFLT